MSLIDRLPDPAEHHKTYADYMRSGKGHVEICECELCGNLSWHCTRIDEPDGYSVRPAQGCQKCLEVKMRAPEVFDWMVRVVGMLGRDIKRAAANGTAE